MTDGLSRTPSDGKSSHGLWPGELKMLIFFFFFYMYTKQPLAPKSICKEAIGYYE
jgi:hypothetical protein